MTLPEEQLSQEASKDKKSSQQQKVCYQEDDEGSECLNHSASFYTTAGLPVSAMLWNLADDS